MNQQITLTTNRSLPFIWTSRHCGTHYPTRPNFLIIKLRDHHFKVSSKILCQSSRYFDALVRFNTDRWNVINEIELVENNQDAFKSIINKLFNLNELSSNTNTTTVSSCDLASNHNMNYQSQSQPDSLDFLFDCVIVCSKYLFDYLERIYSDEFVNKLRNDASDCEVTDIILPKQNRNEYPAKNWLTMLEIYRLAQVYNLHYLTCEIQELIREKRAFLLKRLRNTYYFW